MVINHVSKSWDDPPSRDTSRFSEGAGGSIPPHADLLFEVGGCGGGSQVTVG